MCHTTRVVVFFSVLLMGATAGLAKWMKMDEPVPVERLVKNINRYIEEHPKEAQGYYTLGRVQSLVYAGGGGAVNVVVRRRGEPEVQPEAGSLPGFASYQSVLVETGKLEKLDEVRRNALIDSIRNYRKATELEAEKGLYWLGLGCMLEQAAGHTDALNVGVDLKEKPAGEDGEKLRQVWLDQAVAAYRKAYELTIKEDLVGTHGPAADSMISIEAAQGLVRILEKQKDAPKDELTRLKDSIQQLQRRPMAITPIIFPLQGPATMEELVDRKVSVSFDLAGDGAARRWPWVRPQTGILVWDPLGTGRISSGRQLFGSVTWWMFWENGYEALAALDDDGDGFLRGRELEGVAVWRDANSDGVSQEGEVAPVDAFGIDSIATRGTRTSGGILQNVQGIWMKNGMRLPTYDWTPTSIQNAGR